MANYTKSTNFATKDSLATGNPNKIIKGTEIDTEFNNIASAIFTKQDNLPTGIIVLWSGATNAVPAGWALCNGASGTPDLRDKFIVGAGSNYAVGGTGGSADAVVVSHTHTATVTDPGHVHNMQRVATINDLDGADGNIDGSVHVTPSDRNWTNRNTDSATTGITVANSTTGVDGTGKNLPPYYALAYIMKL